VATIGAKAIYRIDDWELLPLARSDAHLLEEERLTNAVYLQMVWQVLRTPHFYYSTKFDITHSLQRRNKTSPGFTQMSLFARADLRFVWNQQLLAEWGTGDIQLQKFLIPLLHGFVKQHHIALKNGATFDYTLVSRRSVQRAGTRYNTRGADLEGNVANFVETEIIIETKRGRSSLVQTRGSIPLLWHQLPDLRQVDIPEDMIINNGPLKRKAVVQLLPVK
ncbi:phosphatidylinositide phosphatase SAC1-like, partial [Tropilaelaps mercedesae]